MSTFDKSQHDRAGDGKFAPMDAGRPAAGQVAGAFDEDEADETMALAAGGAGGNPPRPPATGGTGAGDDEERERLARVQRSRARMADARKALGNRLPDGVVSTTPGHVRVTEGPAFVEYEDVDDNQAIVRQGNGVQTKTRTFHKTDERNFTDHERLDRGNGQWETTTRVTQGNRQTTTTSTSKGEETRQVDTVPGGFAETRSPHEVVLDIAPNNRNGGRP